MNAHHGVAQLTNVLQGLQDATDTDGDGLSDPEEISKGTSPLKGDTDGDLWKDSIDPFPTGALFPNAIIAAFAIALVAFFLKR